MANGENSDGKELGPAKTAEGGGGSGLTGENYEDWAKHVRNALRTKRKLGFIDGTLEKPTKDDEIEQWEVVNSMLIAWIMNTIEPTLRTSISMVDEAQVLWEDLKLQFSAGNGPRISELRADIANCRQNGDTVMVYYGRLKKMWDELAIYKPIRSCSCGELAAQLEEDRNEERTNTFLNGLDSAKFGTVRSTITSMEPLPKLSQVYQRIIREERQLTITSNRDATPEAVGFAVQAAQRGQTSSFYREKDVTCTHCGKYGHAKADCFQIIGLPEWWGERGRDYNDRGRGGRGRGGRGGRFGRGRGSGGRANAVTGVQANIVGGIQANSTRTPADLDRQSLPQMSDDQWNSLKGLFDSQKSNPNAKLNGKKECVDFIIDTGASHHMTGNLDYLSNVMNTNPCMIGLPDGDHVVSTQHGDICLGGDLWLQGVLYSKDLTCSLISVAKLLKVVKGSITFTDELCVIQDRAMKTLIGVGEECGDVYVLRGVIGAKIHKTVSSSGSWELWHRRLGHPSSHVVPYLSSYLDIGKQVSSTTVCDVCLRAKQTRDCFHESSNKAAGIFDLIHCDLWGPYRIVSTSGAAYFLTIVDDYSRAVWVHLLREKSEVGVTLKNFFKMVERQFEKKVKVVRSDNGGEFMGLRSYFLEEGIMHQTSCVYTPQQNGRVERKHRHILNVARSLMFQATLPRQFWGECVMTACHLINRTPSTVLQGKTPYQLLFGEVPNITHLRVFGSLCFARNVLRDKDKFGERSRRCVFMGYPFGQKGWRVYDLEKLEFFVSRDVVFQEDAFPYQLSEQRSTDPQPGSIDPAQFEDDQFRPETTRSIDPASGSIDPELLTFDELTDQTGSIDPAQRSIDPKLLTCDELGPETERSIDPTPRSIDPETRTEPSATNGSIDPTPGSIDPASSSSGVHITGSKDNKKTSDTALAERGSQLENDNPTSEGIKVRQSERERKPPAHLSDYVLHTTRCSVEHPTLSPAPTQSASSAPGTVLYPIANYVSCDRFSDSQRAFLAAITAVSVPKSYSEAVKDEKWCNAMSGEVNALEANDTWDITDLPPGKKAIGSHWIFTIKYKSNGEIERYKARLVAMGNRQVEGLDFDETFAPVVKMTTIREFLKIAAVKGWVVHQMDVHNAFLHGDLEEEVYMRLPPGFVSQDKSKVCRLKKSLYGLRQAPRCWFAKLAAALKGYGFAQQVADYSLFTLERGSMQLFVLVYVDDLLIGGNDLNGVQEFKGYLSECFHMKDLGAMKYFLGIEVSRSHDGFYLSQRKYALDIVSECGLLGCQPVSTPLEQNHKLPDDEGEFYEDVERYRRLVGRLVYLTFTRPDLSYVVHMLAQFMQQPRAKHWAAVIRVVRYLKGCPGQGIVLSSDPDLQLTAYCDSDFSTCSMSRRSVTGFIVMLGDSPIAWKTKKQDVVSFSSAEAEYRAMSFTTRELKWNRELLGCFGVSHPQAMRLFCDNKAALHIAANPVFHERTKHIERDCHFIRHEIQDGSLVTAHLTTTEQPADIFTKALGSQQFAYLRRKLGMYNLHAPT
ncbi:Retrotransposon Copia-like N-terminal [Arabidopsis thaliana x Arabidopsis arenosa]|uniref:Retrotransposon Copia-like N-terminal n=1 Tax=Arabidopsis thaliana x Arabidopsis arenosa TaxID=1240361 RepID=A0A8T2AVV2_9BRAS|nr:Retrotransposon Copia-like N-terminal [Arabidopsis thaliana x Arabidopsis arenosa]